MKLKLNSIPRIIPWILRHSRLVIGIALLLTAFSCYWISQLKVHSNFDELLPDDLPSVQEFHRLSKLVGGASFIVVTAETSSANNAKEFFDKLYRQLEGHPLVRYIDYIPPTDFFRRHGLLYPPLDELAKIKDRIVRTIDQKKLKKTGFLLDLDDESDDTIDFAEYEKKYPQLFDKRKLYQNEENNFFVFLIKPQGNATQTDSSKKLIHLVRKTISDLKPESYPSPIKVQLTGPYIKALHENEVVINDAKWISLTALTGIVLFLTLYFRRKRAIFVIGIPLIMSVTWSLALAYFLFSFLNLFTSFACAILLGLGIDSGIHLFHKYRSLRLLGSPIEEALSEAYQRLHRSMIMATITTSFAFFALTLSGFKAIFQFGVIAGVGMIFCFISMVFIFPAIAYEFEKLSPIKPIPPKPRLINFNNLQKVILSRKSFIISSLIIACFTIPVIIKGVTFNYNFTEVMAPLNKKALNDRVDAIFSMTVNPQVARTENAQDAQALAEAIRQTQKINNKKSPEGSTIQTTISLLDFIPTGQEEKKRLIRQINAKLTDTVIKSLNENEKKWFQAFKEASNPLTFNVEHLPESILNKFRDLQGELGRYLYIFPNIDMSTKRFLDLVEELRSVKCDDCEYPVYFSGESIIFYEILHILTHQGPYVALASIVFVFIVLMLVLRNIRLALLVFSPIFLTLATLLGVMALFDLKFNVANLICVPLLIGAGIDYSIYLFQQYREANMKISLAYPRCASAILASAITTMIGFSALMMADNGGAYSVGLLTTLGILSCLFITLMWFTSLLSQDFKWTR